jgi:2-dehydro-3-deoxyphosphooctonate aldolase (KDO 8-P synthase)
MHKVILTDRIGVGNGEQLLLIAGPCVIENREVLFEAAGFLTELSKRHPINLVFKSSFDKANRSSLSSYRGPNIGEGLKILSEVKEKFDLPLLSDIHEKWQVKEAAKVLDILQIPAFLCRQTDLLLAAGETGKAVNIKKGQFMSPEDMFNSVEKVKSTGNENVFVTERGTTFGYNNLVVDMRSFAVMRRFVPVVFDATHSVQAPGGLGIASGGERELAPPLARAAVAAGADGIFMEVHPDPDRALCDGPNSVKLSEVERIIRSLVALYRVRFEE